ncbi:hypothetical protein F3Y22_tig00112349pilonHSYRG00050 [Hibiscus syriacus]|uniref:Protein kinase domain-containing protein n=1 Tax=Hibiscus syriacus TaxID=106335 RepID=A0A6A2X0B2_HIBSY|nr:hypothetical protein F3Y22_tig00112349pilonHSYRG00050 [Hibiscus syriacus]
MGCVSSKQTVLVTPAFDLSGALRDNAGAACSTGTGSCRYGVGLSELEKKRGSGRKTKKKGSNGGGVSDLGCVFGLRGSDFGESGWASSRSDSLSLRLGNLQKYIECEHVAIGWPAWLSAIAGTHVENHTLLVMSEYAIGQGTYSTVFRARDLESGRIVALKKVQFDNFEPESVRFMAREILILRRLDHPNIIKLDGIVTSRMSCSICLVLEYMEHDITGLLSCPDIMFSEQPLTIRVVSLWYRPPELLLGSTDYTAAVDLWSVGCVFSKILRWKPILVFLLRMFPSTTVPIFEVEQLHKIFKLCGSPPDDYWKNVRLPHATIFKPQQPYDSILRDTFKDLPVSAVNLIETLLSVEPYKRGTASSALASEPYACDPSSLPVYPPSKEIDAKRREEARRKKISGRVLGPETRKPTRKPHSISKLAPVEDAAAQAQIYQIINGNDVLKSKQRNARSVMLDSKGHDSYEAAKRAMQKKWNQFEHPNSLDTSDRCLSQELSLVLYQREEMAAKSNNLDYQDEREKVQFSGPLLCQSNRVDELLERNKRHIRQATRKSWFRRGRKHGK